MQQQHLYGASATFTVSVSAGAVLAGAAAGICVGVAIKKGMIPEDLYLPAFSITAEEIFRNKIYLFDVNFFEPNEYTRKLDDIPEKTTTISEGTISEQAISGSFQGKFPIRDELNNYISVHGKDAKKITGDIKKSLSNFWAEVNSRLPEGDTFNPVDYYIKIKTKTDTANNGSTRQGSTTNTYTIDISKDNQKQFTITYKHVRSWAGTSIKDTDSIKIVKITPGITGRTEKIASTAEELRNVVSSWYFILRNLALLALMLVLIYTGIRIVIGSTAGEKAKYKERLMDWFVAVCLIFIMHYIMVFAVSMVEEITDLIGATANGNTAYIQLTKKQRENIEDGDKLAEFQKRFGVGKNDVLTGKGGEHGDHGALLWPTDYTGLFRIQSQMEEEGTANWVGFALCYIVLVIFTVFFSFTYIKRVLYMAFLTMIAPLVAMTYPIDKMTDGKAQAFDSWLKEYIFNLMIQPLHLLLYTILVSSAYELASESPIYALVAVGFMMPAEKLMRRFFGFEKAKTPGLLGGAAGAAIAMSGMQNLLKPKHKGGHGGDGNGKGKQEDQGKVKFANKNKVDTMGAIAGDAENKGKKPEGDNPIKSKEYDSRLSKDQIDEKKAEGIGPEDTEYEGYLRQFGINPNEGNAEDVDMQDTIGENDINMTNPDVPENPGTNTAVSPNNNGTQPQATRKKPKRHIMRAVGTATLGVGKQALAGALRGVHPLRLAGKIAAGATVGTAGLLLGVASGDPSKAFQYTTAGAIAGSSLAESLSSRKTNMNGVLEDAKRSYYGEDYSNVQKQKIMEAQRQNLQSSDNVNYLMEMMSVDRTQAKDILETTGSDCFDTGITKVEDIAAIHQLTHGEDAMSFEKAVAARAYAQKRLGGADTEQMTADKVQEYKKRWASEFKDRYKNLNDKQAQDLANQAFQSAIRFNKAKSSLTKF